MNKFFTLLTASLIATGAYARHYVGGDISLLPEYEQAGAQYKDLDGKPIAELLPWLRQQGMNAMRVRLFVNPEKYKTEYGNSSNPDTRYDPNACQSLEYIIPLCKRIVEQGMDLMLDFHYSDTWADPKAQWTPLDWQGLTDEQLYQKIYDYTKECLTTLKEAGVTPKFIQPGNEISYGMLWGSVGTSNPKKALMGSNANWERFGNLLKQAIKACNEACPDAQIIIHTERTPQIDVTTNFYDKMQSLGVDYDIIGLSYYPYWHGKMSVLSTMLATLEAKYPDKKIMIVETGYSYKWEVPGTDIDNTSTWPYSEAGQQKFAADLVSTLEQYKNVNGLFWWWMEYNAYNTKLEGWYNAPLFDSATGKVTPALETLCSFAESSAVTEIVGNEYPADTVWYDISGNKVSNPSEPGLYISRKKKMLIRH